MGANQFNGNSDYGIGIGLRIPHYRHIFEHKPTVGWFEIISENFMVDGGRPLAVLDQILERYRVVQHGVSMYFGSAEPLNREHLAPSEKAGEAHQNSLAHRSSLLGQRGRPLHARSAAHALHFRSGANSRRSKIREARDFLEVPIAVENVSSYAEFHVSEMTEWEFLNEVVERADCGILLDVNNIYVSSRNHSFDPFEYLEQRCPPSASRRSTSPAIRNSKSTSWTRTTIR